ncbi:DUF3500 domain-containing protein [Pseudonocardia sp. ICBG1293]|uniref:DUF3500 domain-containing protein n=1 Tax=Pseudonocardia sp. ICBG1293 TaxID=2844382 RepID=UPI001CCB42CD|nr:DUF3500 domain-containing protein [Pseudonocardia sp. ICBG1293]
MTDPVPSGPAPSGTPASGPPVSGPASWHADAGAAAAAAWLDSLDPDALAVATGAGPSGDAGRDAERRRWFYTPTDHGGLTLHAQSPTAQQRAMQLLATGLSEAGFAAVAAVMGLENVLDRAQGWPTRPYRERFRDPGLYHLRVFGDPGSPTWGWRFGGHHVSVHLLVVDGRVAASTPNFLGANPASVALPGGARSRPLGPPEDLARAIVRGLPVELFDRALLSPQAPPDLVTANRPLVAPGDRPLPTASIRREGPPGGDPVPGTEDVALTAAPAGIPASALDDRGREQLRTLLSAYLDRAPAGLSPMPRYDDDAVLDEVHLAWAGSVEPGEPHYYRLHGPRLLLEWDDTQDGADHAHSVWRDPENDLGLDLLDDHHRAFAHR